MATESEIKTAILFLMSWLVYAFLATAIYSLQIVLQRGTAVESSNPRVTAFIFSSFAILITALIVITKGTYQAGFPTDPLAWLVLAFGATTYGLFERHRFKAAKLLEVSVFDTILNFGVVIAFFGGAILYHEPLTLETLSGGLLIITSLFIVSYQKKQAITIPLKNIIFGVLVSTALGLGWLVDKMGATYFNSEMYGLLVWFFPLPLIAYPSITLRDFKNEPKTVWCETLLLATLNALAYYAMLEALRLAAATKVIPIIQTSVLLSTLLGIFILKERSRIPQKILASVLGVIGVYLLV